MKVDYTQKGYGRIKEVRGLAEIVDTRPKRPGRPGKVFESILVFGLILFSSCAHYKCDPAYDGPQTKSAELLEYYSYPRQAIEARVERIAEKKKYIIERVEFPSSLNYFGTEDIKIDFYVRREDGKFPTILALPISGGVDFCVTSFADYFASNGFNCAVVYNREFELEDTESAEEVENYFRQTVLDNMQVIDYLVEREEVDRNRLGCVGLSLGGIKASLLSAIDERLKCSVIGLAGGSIADITLLSEEDSIEDYKRELIGMGISPQTIHAELSEKVKTDPLRLAEHTNAENVLMYIARFDLVVPRKCCDRLWEAIGRPEVVYFFSGHYTSFLYLPYAHRESLSFFKKKFQIK